MEQITPLHLLKLMSNRHNFDSYNKYVNYSILPQETETLLRDYKKYFKEEKYNEDDNIDFDNFALEFQNHWHHTNLSEEQHRAYSIIINNLQKAEEKSSEVCLTNFFAMETREKISEFWENSFDIERIQEELKKYEDKVSTVVQSKDKDVFTFDQLDLKTIDKKEGVPWALNTLQYNLGSLTLGSFIVVAAYAGVGKSAFCLTQAIHIFKYLQTKKDAGPIMYFSSEGSHQELWTRFLCGLYRRTEEQIIQNEAKVKDHFTKNYKSKLFMSYNLRGKTMQFVRNKMEKYKPSLVVLDLIDHMTHKSENEVIKNRELYQEARELSGEHCPIMATSQADGSATYKNKDTGEWETVRYLGLSQLNYSKVEKQGAAEVMIMIGADNKYPNERYINIVKEKRGKTTKFACKFIDKYSLYEDEI